jgi:hypothetical protein
MRELVWLFAERFLEWEQGLWPTIRGMLTRPGRVIGDYLGGRRRRYVNPFSYLVLCGLFYISVTAAIAIAGTVGSTADPATMQVFGRLGGLEDQYSILTYGAVAAIGVLAPVLWVFFDSRLLNLTEAFVTALYVTGNVFLAAVPVTLVHTFLTGAPLGTVGLALAAVPLFVLAIGHAGYGLFRSGSMAGFAATAAFTAFMTIGIGAMIVSAGFTAGGEGLTAVGFLALFGIAVVGGLMALVGWLTS